MPKLKICFLFYLMSSHVEYDFEIRLLRKEPKNTQEREYTKYIPKMPMPGHRTMPAQNKQNLSNFCVFILLVVKWGNLHKLLMQARLCIVSLFLQQTDWEEEAPKSSSKTQNGRYLKDLNTFKKVKMKIIKSSWIRPSKRVLLLKALKRIYLRKNWTYSDHQ